MLWARRIPCTLITLSAFREHELRTNGFSKQELLLHGPFLWVSMTSVAVEHREFQIGKEMVFFITAQRVVSTAMLMSCCIFADGDVLVPASIRPSVITHVTTSYPLIPRSFLPPFFSPTSCLFPPSSPILPFHTLSFVPPLTSQHQQTPHSRHPPNPPSEP